MEDYKIDDVFLREIKHQFRLWAAFLNNGIGLLAFTLGLACLGTKLPWLNALFVLIVVFLMRWQGKHYFPPKVKALREESKNNEKAKILLKGLEAEFLGFRALLIDYPVFIFGLSFLFVILFSPQIVKLIPSLSYYFGI